ncbi:MAG: trigger factor [Chloroflexota bacterium]|nr:MAG: trigger factor [Chloroflexota bacterium]
MKIETEKLEDHQVKLTVEVESEQLETSKRKAAKKIAKRIKVPGFRPGKAPYQVIRRQVGDEALLEESLEILVQDIYPDIIEEAEIEPYGPGNFENLVSLDPLTLEFVVPLMAEIELSDYHEIRFPYELPEITDEDVEAVENDFRQRQAIEETAERPVEVGDHVYFKVSAKRFEEEEEVEEGSLIEERSSSVIVADEEADTSAEWPFDGFSRELIGMSTDEDKTLLYTFPEDSQFESLRDVTAEFSITIEDVKARILPELNDEFAQSLGEYEDLEAMEKDIRESLEQRAEETYNSEYDDQVIDEIVENSTIKYPPQMLENEINNVIQQLTSRLANQGLDMDIYLKTREMDEEDLREETTPVAETRVKRSLVLLEIAREEEIDVSEEELQEETERTLESITRFMSESDRKQFDEPTAMMNLAGNIYAELRMNRTLEYLRAMAKGESEAEAEDELETVEGESENADQSGEDGPSEEIKAEGSSEEETEDSQITEKAASEVEIEAGEGESLNSDSGDPQAVEETEA